MDRIQLTIDDETVSVPSGTTVASALLALGKSRMRTSVSGSPRAALCGMGICFECRVTIDGQPHRLGCQTLCEPGMEVRTDG